MKINFKILGIVIVIFLTASYKTNSCDLSNKNKTACTNKAATQQTNSTNNNHSLLKLMYSPGASF